jgi:RimJ/RimL family protein N-acetyltransferase
VSPIFLLEWSDADLDLLRLVNTDEMKRHLGGPETDQQVEDRHRRYLAMTDDGAGRMFRVALASTGEPVGTVGYWERAWRDQQVYETGWSVLPGYQGRGIAVGAALGVAERASAQKRLRWLHAYPKVSNEASNAVCRKAGFTLLGECDFEYPPGNPIRCNDWRLDLEGLASGDQAGR